MRRIRRLLRGGSRGLTLVELIIAIALMGIIAVAFFGGLSNAMLALHYADVQTTAESLARSAMEFEKTQEFVDAPWGPKEPPLPDEFHQYTVKVSAQELNDPSIQQILVEVFYHTRPSDDPVTTLVGYKRSSS